MSSPVPIAAVVLAAGCSRRMGAQNKLLLPWGDGTVIEAVVRAVLDSGLGVVRIVVGHEAEEVRQVLSSLPVEFVLNHRFAEGMASSIAAGVNAVEDSASGFMILLGDMPSVRPETLRRLCSVFCGDGGGGMVAPYLDGRQGNPVIFPASMREELAALEGDRGAKSLLARHAVRVTAVDVHDSGILADIDTPAELG